MAEGKDRKVDVIGSPFSVLGLLRKRRKAIESGDPSGDSSGGRLDIIEPRKDLKPSRQKRSY